MIHLATIPVDNTSVNPARSIGTAVFAGGDHLPQLWVFIIFPLVGAVLGVLVWLLVHDERPRGHDLRHASPASSPPATRPPAMAGKVEDRFG